MKLFIVVLMIALGKQLHSFASMILEPFMASPKSKLLVVMILTPICMNALQFWVVDNFIRKQDEDDDFAPQVDDNIVIGRSGFDGIEDVSPSKDDSL